MLICGHYYALAIFREERTTGETIEKMIKSAARINLVER